MLDTDPSLPTALVDFPAPGGGRQRWHFDQPCRWLVAHDASQVPALLDAAHALARAGQWCLGWVAYEAAPAFNPHLPVKALPPGAVYAMWAVFDHAQPGWPDDPAQMARSPSASPHAAASLQTGTWQTGPWQSPLSPERLHQQIEHIRQLIQAGEVYQVNLTAPVSTELQTGSAGTASTSTSTSTAPSASLHAFFGALHRSQPQGYSLMLDARAACRQPGAVLSVSPELFFEWDGQRITTRPMKGTAPRGPDAASDAAAAESLRQSPKERAENLMIVDLLRNDVSQVAQVGSVQVPALFEVQALPTVWQMTSTVTALTRKGTRLSDIFAALFPCGSVTGAPKRQAMHHIARLEPSARGVYCGAVGLMAPGGHVTFNVPIRTVCVDTPPPPAPWLARCGIGSGITLDSTPQGEALEWRHKQAFLQRAQQPFKLLESMRLEQGQIHRLGLHLARLERSARHFHFAQGLPWAEVRARCEAALAAQAAAHPQGVHKLRLLLDAQGQPQAESAPLAGPGSGPMVVPVPVALASQPMPAADDFVRHKTTLRTAYEGSKPPPDCLDTLLYNAQGEITEFTIGNVAMRLGGLWLTPPVHCGLLPGVMRESLLAQGQLLEATITLDDLPHAEGLALINSVRGWVPVLLHPLHP